MKTCVLSWASVSVVVLLAGCGSTTMRVTSTRSAPTVTAVGMQTNGVATNRSIDVMFSTEMDSSTINASTFLLAHASDGKAVAGNVTYSPDSKSASFRPASDLDPLTTYNATFTTGASDTAGNHLATDYKFSFTTRNTDDRSPVAVYQTIPAIGAQRVDVNTTIQVIFTEGADPNSVTPSAFVVRDEAGNIVDGSLTYDISANVATFHPKQALAPGKTYSVTISGIKDLAQVAMTSAYVFTFTTAGDTGPMSDLIYKSEPSFRQISGWVFDSSSGTLRPASGSPTTVTGRFPYYLLPSPDRRFLYATTLGEDNSSYFGCSQGGTDQIDVFSVDHSSGMLTFIQNVKLSGNCPFQSAVIDPTGQFMYVGEEGNVGEGSGIDALRIDTVTGRLSLLPGSPFASGYTPNGNLVLNGPYIYALTNPGSEAIGLYERDASSGSVTFKDGLYTDPLFTKTSLAGVPSGNTLYSASWDPGKLTQYSVDKSTGALTAVDTTIPNSYLSALEIDPTGQYLTCNCPSSRLSLYSIGTSGSLTPLAVSFSSPDTSMASFDSTGEYLAAYSSTFTGTYFDSAIDVFSIKNGTVAHAATTDITTLPSFSAMTMFTK